MNICSTCMCKIGLKVHYPQLVKVVKFCDNCKEKKSSLDIITIVEQMLMVQTTKEEC